MTSRRSHYDDSEQYLYALVDEATNKIVIASRSIARLAVKEKEARKGGKIPPVWRAEMVTTRIYYRNWAESPPPDFFSDPAA
jgi:hypothetical protein